MGRRGVERKFESDLKGTDGSFKSVVDAKGRKIPNSDHLLKDVDRITPARSGHNLVLSLSLPLQQAAEKAFESATAGAIVVLDVHTGFVQAMVSKPAYDPNKLTGRITRAELKAISEDPLEPLIFRAAQQHYSPGSTFKAITALAALREGVISSSSTVGCSGGYTLGKRRWRCHKDSGHGTVNLHNAISWSCDTFFYQASDRMGIDPIAEVGKALGLGRAPGFDLSPETPGIMPSQEYHDRVTPGGYTKGLALNTAIGQGDVNVSPLQLTMAYAAIANGGTVYKPQIVRRIEDAEGHLVRSVEPVVASRLEIKPAWREAVVDGLKAVCNEPGGTAFWKRPKDLAVLVAGKTGTAQVIKLGENRVKKELMDYFTRDHAWFAAFAPIDEPEIAVVVLNEHGGHGGSDSSPAAYEVIKEYFRIKAEEAAARNGAPPAAPEPPASPPAKKTEDPPEGGSTPPREACAPMDETMEEWPWS
ncbi:MAG: penicillin-binding protein 2 [Myxococcales bacterium]